MVDEGSEDVGDWQMGGWVSGNIFPQPLCPRYSPLRRTAVAAQQMQFCHIYELSAPARHSPNTAATSLRRLALANATFHRQLA